jgi:hypothetical protein
MIAQFGAACPQKPPRRRGRPRCASRLTARGRGTGSRQQAAFQPSSIWLGAPVQISVARFIGTYSAAWGGLGGDQRKTGTRAARVSSSLRLGL